MVYHYHEIPKLPFGSGDYPDKVNRTRIEGGGYSEHDIFTWYDQQAGYNIVVDVLL